MESHRIKSDQVKSLVHCTFCIGKRSVRLMLGNPRPSWILDSTPWIPDPCPGYQRFFSRGAGIFGVGRRLTHLRPLAEAARKNSGHYKDLTETGNRARKVSGTLIWHPGYRIPGTGIQSLSVGLGF